MVRQVGNRNRDAFELDPVRALQRGRSLDAMLASTRVPWPGGAMRITHNEMNAADEARQLQAARRLNGAP